MRKLTSELWDEWSAFQAENEELAWAECAGIIAGFPVVKDKEFSVGTTRLWALRRLVKLWKQSDGAGRWNAATSLSVPHDMKGRVQLALPADIFEEVGRYGAGLAGTPLGKLHWSWLRGLWGSSGGFYIPQTGYYLVLRLTNPVTAEVLKKVLARSRIAWGKRSLHGANEFILREQQKIVTFFSKLGLNGFSLRIEEKAIMRSMRDSANRARNCDTANIKRVLKTAEEQTELAKMILNNGLLETLPNSMKQLVLARLENPEASLSDLGDMLSPAITKSTVKYRWERLKKHVGNL